MNRVLLSLFIALFLGSAICAQSLSGNLSNLPEQQMNSPFFLLLNAEKIEVRGETLRAPESIRILGSEENRVFEQYASEHPRREQA